jgi:hypothetical protein
MATGTAARRNPIVSELVTDAMLASRPRGRSFIRLSLTLDQGELGVFVRDYCQL